MLDNVSSTMEPVSDIVDDFLVLSLILYFRFISVKRLFRFCQNDARKRFHAAVFSLQLMKMTEILVVKNF